MINFNAKNPDQKYADEIKRINHELEVLPELYPPTFIVDDITPKSLHKVLKENGERIGILSAEGGIFEIVKGRYSKELNMDLFLKGHSGDFARIDRKNGLPMILQNPLLTIGIIAQPDVLQDLPKAFHGRGLMARFLFSLPKDFRGYRKIRPTDIPLNIQSEYIKNVKRLLVMDTGGTQRLTLTKEADYHFQSLQQNIEERLRDDGDLSGYLEWGGKIVGQLARIAGLLHIAKFITTTNNIPPKIEEDTILSLLQLKEYFVNHAMAAHGCMRTNSEIEDLKYLVSVIGRKAKQKYDKKPAEEITLDYRDIQQSAKDRFVKSHLLKNVLKELEQYGYIREDIVGRKSVYKINPHVFKDNIKVSPNPPSKILGIESNGSNLGMHEIPSVTNPHNSTPLEPNQETIGENGEKWEQEVDLDKPYNSKYQQQMGDMGDDFEGIINKSSIDDECELI